MKKEEIYDEINNYIENNPGFIKYNNMHIEEIKKDYCKMYIDITEDSLNHHNIVHGGLIFGLADTTMGMAAITTGNNIVTINAQIDYLKAGTGKKITCIAEPLKIGKSTAVYRANVYNEDELLIATITGTYFFIKK